MSGIMNKIKEAVHSDSSKNTHGAPEGSTGPHNSRVANAADPRVDSDRDGSHTIGGAGRHTGATRTAGHSEFGSTNPLSGSGTTGYGTATAEGTHGPHSSRLANAADPRVDSDRDGSSTMGGAGRMAGMAGSTGTHSHGLGTTGGTTGGFGTGRGTAEGTHGPHSSRLANAADPRVDSDRDGSSTMGGAGRTAGMTGSHRLGTSRGIGSTGHTDAFGTGPHTSDMMNKADPRIDSDLDGSKTVGGNKTYQSGTNNALYSRDPTDAAQVPPSVLQRHIGEPIVEHDDVHHQRQRRNSVKTSQETFSGI